MHRHFNQGPDLTTLNNDFNYMNNLPSALFPGVATEYLGQNCIPGSDANVITSYPIEYLNYLDPSGLTLYKLQVEVDMRIIFSFDMLNKKKKNSL